MCDQSSLDPLWTGIESKCLISIIHPVHNIRKFFEESFVPSSSYLTVVNNSYLCYANPMNSEQQPLKYAPDIVGARHKFL
ncbi:unnamed protein product [Rotaria magnacalcarata]|uniref:Uncharacterized protein n=2 Tax=Rotaria magnacalcarata TaxID=392030 RepID=A0A820JV69_9BILA|nr:unnamed protein product [Rotaria magnacalcarata]